MLLDPVGRPVTSTAGTRAGRALGALLALLGGLGLGACSEARAPHLLLGSPAVPDDRPIERTPPRFASSDACRACHPREYATWHASFHRTMTQAIDADTVIPAWEGELESRGERFVLERRGSELWVEMDDPEVNRKSPEWQGGAPPRVWRQIVLSTGSHNFQAYWFPSGTSRKLYLFVLCYRIDEGRWMPIDSAFVEPPSAYRQPTLPRWNLACLKCHTTKPRSRAFGPENMDTMAAEFGIACEACHGPGREHVEANQNPLRRYRQHFSDTPDPTIIDPSKLHPDRASQACGQCHGITEIKPDQFARWNEHGSTYEPGRDLFAQCSLVTVGEEFFWPDGQVRVSGREFNGLVRSPCYQHDDPLRKMSCFSCHQMHKTDEDERSLEDWRVYQLKPGMLENSGCTQCHPAYAAPEALAAHTHHAPASVGSSCYECHMPHTVWGLLKAIRVHQVGSPSVQESLAAGRPNACNLCHLDRSLQWTAGKLEEWYGQPAPSVPAEQREVAAGAWWALTGDAGMRALMAWHMGWEPAREASGEDWMAPYLSTLLDDAYDAVRFRSGRSLKSLPGFEDLAYDFVDDAESLAAARAAAMERWRLQAQAGGLPARPELLLAPGGLDRPRFDALLERRDHKRMLLAE